MRTVAVRYQVLEKSQFPYQIPESGKLLMKDLNWPNRCVCCGNISPDSTLKLNYQAKHTYDQATLKVAYYPLLFRIPYCKQCKRHSRSFVDPLALMFLIAFLAWAGLGYLLFTMELAYETPAIAGWIVVLVILSLLAYGLGRFLRHIQKVGSRRMMKPGCMSLQTAIYVHEDSNRSNEILFDFTNDDVAAEFASLNGIT